MTTYRRTVAGIYQMACRCTWPQPVCRNLHQCVPRRRRAIRESIISYQTAGGALVSRLAGHLEGDVVGGGILQLEGRGGGVVEVLGQEL
jgi:glyceraldehyde-3-phosphate dehydrogenase/erythrose-4-phosphate dehydrogenase